MKRGELAYVIGLAIGDGNLSNPNGRAVRLRITCDTKYPNLVERICKALQSVSPINKVSIIPGGKTTYLNVSCYSNQWENLLGWKAKGGSKFNQCVTVPDWIKRNKNFSIACLRGLFETDGSIYKDRGYLMANFVTTIPTLADDVMTMIENLGFKVNCYHLKTKKKDRFNIRISKNTQQFIEFIKINKN